MSENITGAPNLLPIFAQVDQTKWEVWEGKRFAYELRLPLHYAEEQNLKFRLDTDTWEAVVSVYHADGLWKRVTWPMRLRAKLWRIGCHLGICSQVRKLNGSVLRFQGQPPAHRPDQANRHLGPLHGWMRRLLALQRR
ncbi:hypothetical protein [Azospirillum thiophilum]|uniref:hypothetical protein n=1 Tax=Azospirillum thiophilum TaxID=528244 RepID=UPI000AC9EED2|nr:hypothetical protein [Azospirillum thiophilum]